MRQRGSMLRSIRPGNLSIATLAMVICGAASARAQTLLVKGGTLIDGTGRTPIVGARIYIQDGIIRNVWSGESGAPALPAGVATVDATGKYIIPGLIDSHIHYNWYEGEMFLHYGVTSIFDLGGGPWSGAMQKGVEMGAIRAPRYFHHATFGDGANGKD